MKRTALMMSFVCISLMAASSLSAIDFGQLSKAVEKIEKPSATIKKLEIESISLRDVTFLFHVSIKNPYPLSFDLDKIELGFFVEKKQLFKTSTSRRFKVRAHKKRTSVFKVNLAYEDMINIVREYNQKDHLNCDVDIKISIPLPKIPRVPKKVTLEFKRQIKIPTMNPSVSIANFRVQKPSKKDIEAELRRIAKESVSAESVSDMFEDIIAGRKHKQVIDPSQLDLPLKVDFDIVLNNKTKSKLSFSDLNYDFYINGGRLVNGRTSDINARGNEYILRVSNEFSSRALQKTIRDAFEKSKGTFALRGSSKISLPKTIKRKPLTLSFDEKGSFQLN